MDLVWHDRAFADLTVHELYAIVSLRERVFVVEQACVYLDADGVDPISRHVWAARGDELVAYCRIVPPGVKYFEASIGRVIVAASARGSGLGKLLMERAIASLGRADIRIGAQAHLEQFYVDLGFRLVGDPYVEDGIPHVEMVRLAGS